MFRASIGKLSEFPRSIDFRANVTLKTEHPDHILGEPLIVEFLYAHDDDKAQVVDPFRASGRGGRPASRPHSSMDWIGLFKVKQSDDVSKRGRYALQQDRPAINSGTTSRDGRVSLNEHLDFGVCPVPVPVSVLSCPWSCTLTPARSGRW